jgi:hypothetical protein
MATPIGALAADATTWILIGQGNVATGHLIRSAKFTNRSSTTWHFACRSYAAEALTVSGELELMDSPMDKVHTSVA